MIDYKKLNSLPAALRNKVIYEDKLITKKEMIDDIMLVKKLIDVKELTTYKHNPYVIYDHSGHRFTFASKAEKKYIDYLIQLTNEGGQTELEHKATIKKIQIESPSATKAAKYIAADHIHETPDYYHKLEKEMLKDGGPIQELKDGTVLKGPSHDNGGIEIVVNNKPVAEAQGGEVVINAENSKEYCHELSEINQRDGNGKPLDCGCAGEQTDKMEEGGVINDFRPTHSESNKIIIKNNTAYFAGMPFDTLISKSDNSYFGSKSIYSVVSKKNNFKLGEIALDENSIKSLKNQVKNIVNKKSMKKGGKIYNEELNIGNIDDSEIETMAEGGSIGGKPLFTGADASRQVKKELKEKFPSIKFSVRYSSYSGGDSIRVSWNFGPTTAEIDAIINKYQYGNFDGMTDSYSINDDNQKFVDEQGKVRDIGGVKYVFSERTTYLNNGVEPNEQWEKETSIQLLIAKDLIAAQKKEWKGQYTPMYDNSNETAKDIAYRILRKNSFDTDDVKTYDGIFPTGVTSGFLEEFYVIKYNSDKISVNKEAEKKLAYNQEWERTRPEREAKEKKDREEYEAREADRKKAISELNIKQYEMLDDADYFIKSVQWPSLNKNSTLAEYKEELEKDIAEKKEITQKAMIKQVIIVNNKDFEVLSNNLTTSLPEVWKNIGGNDIPLAVMVQFDIDEKQWKTFQFQKTR